MKLEQLAELAERQLADIEHERYLFDTRNYLAALRRRVEELEHLEIDYRIVKGRLLALQNEILRLGARQPLASKLVETRGNGARDVVPATRRNFAVTDVEHLDYPSTFTGPQRTEVPVEVQGVVECHSVESEEIG